MPIMSHAPLLFFFHHVLLLLRRASDMIFRFSLIFSLIFRHFALRRIRQFIAMLIALPPALKMRIKSHAMRFIYLRAHGSHAA